MSTDERVAPGTIRSILREARRRKLLTASPSGRAGGELTARAERLLRGRRTAGRLDLAELPARVHSNESLRARKTP